MFNFLRVECGALDFAPGSGTLLHDSDTVLGVLKLSYPKTFGDSISNITIELVKDATTVNDSILGDGKELRVWHNTALPVGYTTRLFRGFVTNKKIDGPRVIITASDLFVKAMWAVGSVSPEPYETSASIKTILTTLCTAAGLTASFDATAMVPATVEQFYYNNQNIYERISYILNLTGWYAYYDPATTATIKFQPKSAGATETFDSSNIISKPSWNADSSSLVNDVILIGGSNNITTVYSVATTGGKSYIIPDLHARLENVIVSLYSDLSSPYNADEYTILGISSTGIWFTKGTEPAVSQTIYIQYTYQTESGTNSSSNVGSQSAYIKRSKVIQKRDTLNSTDLGSWASNLVADAFWGKPIENVSFLAMETPTYPIIIGSKAEVTDPMTGVTLSYAGGDNSIVYNIEHQWPQPGTRVSISTQPLKNPMQQTSVQDSLEKVQLELKKINPTSLLRKDGTTPILGSQDFAGYELRNVSLENSAVAPGNLGTGGVYFNTAAGAGKGIPTINLGTAVTPIWTAIGMGEDIIDGSGTAGYIPKFTDSNTLANSHISDDGTNVTIVLGATGTLTITRV